MSEFQYYEFKSIDRDLSKEEMEEVADMSSRVVLTELKENYSRKSALMRRLETIK